jgi:hypothetical protein
MVRFLKSPGNVKALLYRAAGKHVGSANITFLYQEESVAFLFCKNKTLSINKETFNCWEIAHQFSGVEGLECSFVVLALLLICLGQRSCDRASCLACD